MNERYENRRENLFKEFRSYEGDVKIRGKHYSFFVERKGNEVPCNGVVFKPPQTDYTVTCETSKAITWLDSKLLTKALKPRKSTLEMKEYQLQEYANLYHYLDQCLAGGYKKCLLSKKEFAIIFPK